MARRRRLSVWGVLRKLGHRLGVGCPDDRDAVIQHVFETVGSMSVSSPDGDVAAGTPEVLHYLHDVLGSVVALTNASVMLSSATITIPMAKPTSPTAR